MTATAVSTGAAPRTLRLRGRAFPVILPAHDDPRLQLAAVITILQVLGQTVLHFEVSVAQILLSLGTCLVVETGYTLLTRGVLMWPASALLTGNSVAFIMRSSGTRWGDWWSLDGWHVFVIAALLSLASKHLLRRRRGHHVFNPSNFGLLAAFVLFGTGRANPQDLWWGAMSPGLAATLAVIVVGGLAVVWRLRMLGMVAAFWLGLAALVGVLAGSGHCMSARWHVGAVCGGTFWSSVVLSPEILVFVFFMITDPRTSPRGGAARIAYGLCTAAVATLLMAPWQTEFATKVAVLDALVLTCALLPLLELVAPMALRRGVLAPAAAVAALCGLVVAAGIPARGAAAAAEGVGVPGVAVGALPPGVVAPRVVVSDAARQADPSLDDAAAQAMGRAVAAQYPAYRLATATVVLIRDPAAPQAAPGLGLAASGTVLREGRPVAFRGVFVAAAGSGGYRLGDGS